MKKREPAGEGRNRKRIIRPLTACLLAAVIVAAAVQIPNVAAKAEPLKLEPGSCSLTVQPCFDEKSSEDLLGPNNSDNEVAIDLYKVADAVKAAGYDSYGFEVAEAYGSLAESLTQEALSAEGMDNEQWLTLAKDVAKIALAGQEKVNPDQQYMATEKIDNLDPGLYLMVARDAKPETGKKIFEAENADSEEDSGTASKIYTERYEYTFEPQLVAIPGKPIAGGNGEIESNNTANGGDWTYDMLTTLKPERIERFGSLRLTKSLQAYNTKEPATFVFRVNAYRDDNEDGDNELIYSNVVGVTFDRPGQQEVVLTDQIPVDARIEITEEYSGAAYTIVGDAEKTLNGLISADDMLETEFTNTYDDHNRGGHGIVNSFSFDGDGWHWDQEQEAAE